MIYTPPFVTETDEPAPFYGCVSAAGLMLANAATYGEYPIGREAREAIHRAGGVALDDGMTGVELLTGLRLRFGWHAHYVRGTWAQLLGAMGPAGSAVLFGRYGRLPDYYYRWGRSFATGAGWDGHAVYIQRRPGDARLWWMDPLGRGTYAGEWITTAIAQTFAAGMGQVLAVAVRQGEHEAVITIGLLPAGSALEIRPGVRIIGYRYPGLEVGKATALATRTRTPVDAYIDIRRAGVTRRFVRVTGGVWAGLLLDQTVVGLVPAPPPPPPPAPTIAVLRAGDELRAGDRVLARVEAA